MGNLFKAFFFKIRKDLSFRITAFIGLGFAILLPTILFLIDVAFSFIDGGTEIVHTFCTGQGMIVSSFSPTQNFGLAIPINLITFTVLEFTNGTIRNKVISGYSKTKIYLGLYLTGLLYTLIFISAYVLLTFGLGCAYGGFNPNGSFFSLSSLGGGQMTPDFIWKFVVLALLAYMVLASMTIFFASLFRHIGPSIPVVIVLIFVFSAMATIATVADLLADPELDADSYAKILKGFCAFLKAVNPIHSLLMFDSTMDMETYVSTIGISWNSFFTEIANNLVYIAGFFVGGLLIFKKRDIK